MDAGLAVRDNREKLTTKRHIGDNILRVKKTTDAAIAERMDRDNIWTKKFVKELLAEVAKNKLEDTTAGKKHPRDKDNNNINERLPKHTKIRI